MRVVNEYLATTPFDLYELHLFHLVVKHRSFTKAAEMAGLTQSAITRQMQGMENSLGLALLERTTRTVRLTPAGEFLYRESGRLLGDVDQSIQRLREEFAGAKKEVRVGVSRTITLSHLPGFFHANVRRLPEAACQVSHIASTEMLTALEANELDLGVLCPPSKLPKTVRVTHQFEDAFVLIASMAVAEGFDAMTANRKARNKWMSEQNWLLISDQSNTGMQLRAWMTKQDWRVEPTMQLDNFDLIISLVSLGMGISFVPSRALSLYSQKRTIQRLPLRERFVRELVVVVRKNRKLPKHLEQFVENVLF
jgi:DNA-binding transcriptional LysR family regulator